MPRWAFLRRRRARREQEAEALVQRGVALRDWLGDIVLDHPYEEAADLFAEKVIREDIYTDLIWWVSEGHLDSKALEMFREGQDRMLAKAVAHAEQFLREELRKPPTRFTDRELDVLKLVAKGLNNRDIGIELNLSEDAVKNHVRNILKKQVRNILEKLRLR